MTPLWFWEHRYFCFGDVMGEDDPLLEMFVEVPYREGRRVVSA